MKWCYNLRLTFVPVRLPPGSPYRRSRMIFILTYSDMIPSISFYYSSWKALAADDIDIHRCLTWMRELGDRKLQLPHLWDNVKKGQSSSFFYAKVLPNDYTKQALDSKWFLRGMIIPCNTKIAEGITDSATSYHTSLLLHRLICYQDSSVSVLGYQCILDSSRYYYPSPILSEG